jgi:hypothetical protein
MAGDQGNRVVVGGKKHPSVESMFAAEVHENVNSSSVITLRPGDSTANVARRGCDQMPALSDNPDGYAPTSQTASHAQGTVISAHQQRAGDRRIAASAACAVCFLIRD